MRKVVSVKLSTPIEVFGQRHGEIWLKEPNAATYFELGPTSATYNTGAGESTYDLPGVFRLYLERCISSDRSGSDPFEGVEVLLADMNLEDAIRVRRAFNSFFGEALDRIIAAEAPKPPPPAA